MPSKPSQEDTNTTTASNNNHATPTTPANNKPLRPRPSLSLLQPSLRPLASPTFNDPSFRPVSMSRTVTHNSRGHTLMGATWNTPDTIPHLISFYRPSSSSNSSVASVSAATSTTTTTNTNHNASPTSDDDLDLNPTTRLEVRRIYVFGGALNAHPDLLHGGVISCILDSSLGGVVGMSVGASDKGRGHVEGAPMYTVQLNVRYRKPVRTPGGVLVRSWVVRREEEGRKVWARGVVEGWDADADGDGKGKGTVVVHAEAEGMWVRAGRKGGGKL